MAAKPGKGTLLGHGIPITHTTSEIDIPILSTSTNKDLETFMTLKMSAGRFTGGAVSDAGSGNVLVAKGTGLLRVSNSDTARLISIDWPAVTLAIPTNSVRHVFVEYNSGTPRAVLSATDDPNLHDEFPLASIVREEDTTLHLENDPEDINNVIGHILRRFYKTRPLERDERLGGLIIGESGDSDRFMTLSGGGLFERSNEFLITDKDTDPNGGADTLSTYFATAPGVFTRTDGVTAWPFTQYNDGSGLVTMTNNRFAVLWFYIEEDDNYLMRYGTAQYTSEAMAETEIEPSDQPNRIKEHAKLTGRLIFKKSTTPAESLESAFGAVFAGAIVTNHKDLAGLELDNHDSTTNGYQLRELDSTVTDNALARWDGTTGRNQQNSAVIVDDSDNVTGVAALTMSGNLQIGGALNHDGATIGFHGTTPVAKTTGWSVTNHNNLKVINANSFTLSEMGDIVGEILTILLARGDIGA